MSEAVLGQILTELQSLRTGQEALRTGQEALRTGQDTLRMGQDTLRVDVMARMDRLQDSVTSLREDVAVNFARADHASRSVVQFRNEQTSTTTALRNDLDAMNEFIVAIEKKVRSLSNQFHAFRQERDGGAAPGH
jgi:uncharacterized phage infection (PIP) family protein YhgE